MMRQENKTRCELLKRAIRQRFDMITEGYLFRHDAVMPDGNIHRITVDTNWNGEEVWLNDMIMVKDQGRNDYWHFDQRRSVQHVLKGPRRVKRAIKWYRRRVYGRADLPI